MRAMSLLVAVFAVSTQGCAAVMSEMSTGPSDRPSVANSAGGISRRAPMSVPSNLPLPIHADPRTRMAVPSLSEVSRPTYGTMMTVYAFLACFPVMGSVPESCDENAIGAFQRNIREPAQKKGPIILR